MDYGEVIEKLCKKCRYYARCGTRESMSSMPQREAASENCDMYKPIKKEP